MHSIAIIGSGPTAIYAAKYLLELKEPLEITVFEKQSEAGKGTPYHQDWNDSQMLANIASIELPPVKLSLVDWLETQSDETLSRMGITRDGIDERSFFPRVLLGEYLKSQLHSLITDAPGAACTITLKTSHEVRDVELGQRSIKIKVQHNQHRYSQNFDYVIMATGHAWPKHTEIRPGYFLSPWPASALRTIGHCHVGIRGTSLSAIDAAVALAVARGSFERNEDGVLHYHPEPGTETFRMTMMSRKGVLPEADFYHPIPYEPLLLCTKEAVDNLIEQCPRNTLLEEVYALFKAEIIACDPAYAALMELHSLTLEAFSQAYFSQREHAEVFTWAEQNLTEARKNLNARFTVPWRYAILRMHEIVARVVPMLSAADHKRFTEYFKPIFVDDYATVPHESIERLLALHRARKLEVIKLESDHVLDMEHQPCGAALTQSGTTIQFPAFIDAMGQRTLSAHEFPFPSLWEQGIVQNATAPHFVYTGLGQRISQPVDIGGIALDKTYHPICDSSMAMQLYCLSLPFMLGQFPFAQGITSSHDMSKKVAEDIGKRIALADITSLSAVKEVA